MKTPFISLQQAIDDLKAGKMIILQDSEDRENEGDILFLASKTDMEKIRFTTNVARGLLCVAISPEKAEKLGLSLMCSLDESQHGTPFTQSVDVKAGTTTGISIADRVATVIKIGDPNATGDDFYKPGHIFPLLANKNGLDARQGHTEGSVELARLAGEEEAVAICEVLGAEDDMARGQELIDFATEHGIGLLTMETLLESRFAPQTETFLPTPYGDFTMYTFSNGMAEPDIALVSGDLAPQEDPLVRIHSECLTGDLLGSHRCDCGEQKEEALKRIGREGGIFLYLRQEGRGIGLVEKLKAYQLQDQGLDTVEANLALGHKEDQRDYNHALAILKYFKVESLRLLTNNPYKIAPLVTSGIKVIREPLEVSAGVHNLRYLATKKERMSHLLTLEI